MRRLLIVLSLALGFHSVARMAGPPVLAVAGTRLTVDGAPRFLVFISYFDGVRRARAGELDADMTFLAERVDGIRVMPNWWASVCPLRAGTDTLIDADGRIRESTWRDVQRLLDAASARGLLVDLSFTRDTVVVDGPPRRTLTAEAYEAALVRIVSSPEYLKGRYPNVLVDVENEWPRFSSAAQVERLLRRLHAEDATRILTASVSGDAYVATGNSIPTMVAAYHEPRGKDWFTRDVISAQVRKVRAAIPRQPIYLQEPMPVSSVCEGQIVDREATHFAAARDAARDSGAAAWTFHTRTTFDLSKESLVEKLRSPGRAGEKAALDELGR